jgi:hypothetical protein
MGSKLVECDLRGKQLVDDIRHPTSMTNAVDTAMAGGEGRRVRTTTFKSSKTADGTTFETCPCVATYT